MSQPLCGKHTNFETTYYKITGDAKHGTYFFFSFSLLEVSLLQMGKVEQAAPSSDLAENKCIEAGRSMTELEDKTFEV